LLAKAQIMLLEVEGIHNQFKPKKCVLMVFSIVILGFIVSKKGKLLDLKKI
jgi:hypothetical protein